MEAHSSEPWEMMQITPQVLSLECAELGVVYAFIAVEGVSQSIQAAKIKSHKLGAYNQHTFISHSSGTLKSGCQHGLVLDGGVHFWDTES